VRGRNGAAEEEEVANPVFLEDCFGLRRAGHLPGVASGNGAIGQGEKSSETPLTTELLDRLSGPLPQLTRRVKMQSSFMAGRKL